MITDGDPVAKCGDERGGYICERYWGHRGDHMQALSMMEGRVSWPGDTPEAPTVLRQQEQEQHHREALAEHYTLKGYQMAVRELFGIVPGKHAADEEES